MTIIVLTILSLFVLTGSGHLWAFSVDVKKLYYADNLDPSTLKRIVNYDFSDGTLSTNTIAIPDSFITKPPSDDGLYYVFGPYPDPNDISVALDTGALKATLTSAAQGGCIINTISNPPDSISAVPQWEFSVQLTHFTGMTETSKAYRAQIGFGSMTPGPHPEFTATWAPGANGRILVLRAEIYNDSTDQNEWSLTSAPLTGLDPGSAFIELRVRSVPGNGYRDMIFEYRLSEAGNWINLGTHIVNPTNPPLYLSFPAQFPYVSLDTEDATSAPSYNIQILNNKISVIKGQTAEFILAVQFNDYTSAQGISFTTDNPTLNAVFAPVPVKNNGGVVMKIDTTGLAAGAYSTNILYGEGTPDAGTIPFTLEVLTVTDIKFFEYDTSNPPQKVYITSKNVDFQGQFGEGDGVSYEVQTSDGRNMPNSENGVTLTSLSPGVIGAYLRYWGYDLYSLANGSATLRAQSPDGTFRDLTVTVAIPADAPQITSVGLNPAVVSNKGTDTIDFHATSNETPNRISGVGADMSGYMNLDFDFLENTVYSPLNENTRVDSSFDIINPPADLGTAILYASASRNGYSGSSKAALSLTTVNDPTYSGLRVAFKPIDPSIFGGDMFDIEFYTPANTTTPAFTKTIFSMNTGTGAPIDVGGIAPGTYKIRFVAFGGILPQWWPNADDPGDAQALDFIAGQFVENVFFFARPVPTIFLNGTVWDTANNLVSDAAVNVNANSYVPGTTTDVNGNFTLTGIPLGQDFDLMISKTGFTTVYSGIFNRTNNIQTLLPYRLFPAGALGTWGVASGNGAILGRVTQISNPTGSLSGATVTAVNAADTNQTYPVTYQNPSDGTFGGTATFDNGVFAVLNVPDNITVKLTGSKAGWTFAQSAWVKVRGDTVSEASLFGTDPLAGAWGVLHLQYEVGPHSWFSEASRVTFNGDGTGTLSGMKNDEENWGTVDQIKPFTFDFTYTFSPNTDGSLNLAMTVGVETFTQRVVLSDNGNMAIQDGTIDPNWWVNLSTLIRIDTTKSYNINDFSGDYYGIGYERNRGTAIEDPPNGNGAYMAISSVESFNSGSGTYNYYGYANSIKSDGSAVIWNDTGFGTARPYAVNTDGTVSVQDGAFQGFLTGNGAVGIGSGSFSMDGPDTWAEYAFLKKGDRSVSYTTADMAGKWALVGFGDDNDSTQTFAADIGTMTCDAAGQCSYKFKRSSSDGAAMISTGNVVVSVDSEGGFGASLPGGPPAYAGAIGNDGNTLIFNKSFDPTQTWHRKIFIGVRASGVGDLAGTLLPLKGDLNGDWKVTLEDAILALRVITGMNSAGVQVSGDVNGDGRIGFAELIYILQKTGGVR